MISVGTRIMSMCDIHRGQIGTVVSVDYGCYTVIFCDGEEHLLFKDEVKICQGGQG